MKVALCFVLFVCGGMAQPDPKALLASAKASVLTSREQAIAELRQATAIWEKQGSKSSDYAEALDLLGMALYPSLEGKKDALEQQVEPLARKALELRQANPQTKTADLALANEFEAMVLEQLGRIEDSREPKAKARALRDQLIVAMQPPAEDVTRDSIHLGAERPGLEGPRLYARADPEMTFEARVLRLKQPEVIADVIIGTDGQMHNIEIFKPMGFGLDEKAVEALKKWRFQPAKKDGKPVAAEGNLRMRFLP